MKKILFLLFALLCSVSFFSSCTKDKDNGGKGPSANDVNASYTGDKLVLTYSGSPMPGKTADFMTSDKATATLTLKNIIPGEASTTVSNVKLKPSADETQYSFEGTDEQNGRKAVYKGTVKKGNLVLSLDVTMPANELTGKKWYPLPTIPGDDPFGLAPNKQQCVIFDWDTDYVFNPKDPKDPKDPKPLPVPAKNFAGMFGVIGSNYLADMGLLKEVSFLADGNIQATYSSLKNKESQISPLNVAQYYIKDNKLYLLLNMDIMKASSQPPVKAGSSPMDGPLKLLEAGIPLNYAVDKASGTMKAYVDKEFITPFADLAPILGSMLPKDPDAAIQAFIPTLKAVLTDFPAAMKATRSIAIGLALTTKSK